jgi:hypothetical protein
MRLLGVALVTALAAGAYLMPAPEAPGPGPAPGVEEPAVAVCAVEEGAGRTTEISVLSTVDGPSSVTLFTGGGTAGSIGQETGASGSIVVPVVDVAAVGTVGGLVEMPNARSAAGAVVFGSESLSAEACGTAPEPLTLITGGSTASGKTFVLHLMNPYAGEAIVELDVRSEAGAESNDRFETVIVPSLSSTFVDFTDLIPGREAISVTIETVTGRVMAVGRGGNARGSAVWRATAPTQDWFIPIPAGPGPKELVIATSSDSEVAFQVDIYGPAGFEEGFISDTLPSRGRSTIDLAGISAEAMGVRIVAAGPLVPVLLIDSEEGLAATTGSPVSASRWFIPGASSVEGGWSTVVVLNVGIEDGSVTFRPLREGTSTRTIDVESDAIVEIGLESADGYLIESTSPVAVLWSAQREGGVLLTTGVPIFDE